MKLKELVKTKTFWGGLGLVAYGIVRVSQGDTEGMREILEGLSIIFLRQAVGKR